jgi:N-acetylmuramoyl-L-alanine amidase
MAIRLQAELESRGVRVVMTKRSADENVSNEDRAATANRANADLFLRLHCDADTGRGIATFYPDRQGSKNGVRGPSRETIAESRRRARQFHAALIASLDGALPDRGLRTDQKTAVGRRQGGALTGSIYSRVPVLLVEMCVLTNPKDEAFIISEKGQQRLTRALADGTVAALRPREGGARTERASD